MNWEIRVSKRQIVLCRLNCVLVCLLGTGCKIAKEYSKWQISSYFFEACLDHLLLKGVCVIPEIHWSIEALGGTHKSIAPFNHSTFQGTLLSQGLEGILNPETNSCDSCPRHQKAFHFDESLREEIVLGVSMLHFRAY